VVNDLQAAVAASNTDSIVVPCDEQGSPFPCPGAPGGQVRHLTPEELQGVLDSFLPLGIRWKVEVEPSTALVIGTNKVIFGHENPDGQWVLDRSVDTALGGHVADPSDTPGLLLADSHWAWPARLLGPVLGAAASHGEADLARPLPLPDDLPSWAYERPVLRRFQASRWSTLKHLRQATGAPKVGPYATYLRADTGGEEPAPVALGPGWDPRTWIGLDFRIGGEPVGVEVLTPDGLRFVGGDPNARRVVVRSVADYLAHWLTPETDQSLLGPARGFRHPVPVRSTASATRVVGRHGEALLAVYEDPETLIAELDQLDYGHLLDPTELRGRVRRARLREVARRSGVPVSTLSEWVRGRAGSEDLLVTVAMALDELDLEPVRICSLPGCERPTISRRAKWCCPAHRAKGSRVNRGLTGWGRHRTTWAREAEREMAWREGGGR
jgi:hypothetical protein